MGCQFEALQGVRLLVELGPLSALSKPTTIAAFFVAILVYIVIPVFLVVLEYRLTCRGPKFGIYLLVGILATAIILGLYSLIIAAILAVVSAFALQKRQHK